jgi:hypothetical protein
MERQGEIRKCERDSSGTTVATEVRSTKGAKVMERIARRPTRSGGRLAQIVNVLIG